MSDFLNDNFTAFYRLSETSIDAKNIAIKLNSKVTTTLKKLQEFLDSEDLEAPAIIMPYQPEGFIDRKAKKKKEDKKKQEERRRARREPEVE